MWVRPPGPGAARPGPRGRPARAPGPPPPGGRPAEPGPRGRPRPKVESTQPYITKPYITNKYQLISTNINKKNIFLVIVINFYIILLLFIRHYYYYIVVLLLLLVVRFCVQVRGQRPERRGGAYPVPYI